jgi:peptide/nickel transport system permease protein
MQRYVARQAIRLVVGVLGAVLIAAAIAAAGEPHARNLPGFLSTMLAHLGQFARLDLGVSAISGATVLDDLRSHLPKTLGLIAMGGGLAVIAGAPIGLALAFGPIRRIASPLIQVITATPVFVSGLALAYIAVHALNWPVSVNAPVGAAVPPDQLLPITALPVLTIGLAGAAAVQLVLRQAAARSSGEAFRTGLKRMGLGAIEIEARYVLPEVFAALVSGAREIVLALVSATVVAEWVFHRDGAADLFVRSVALADWNMAAILLFVFAAITFLADFLGSVIGHALAPGETA